MRPAEKMQAFLIDALAATTGGFVYNTVVSLREGQEDEFEDGPTIVHVYTGSESEQLLSGSILDLNETFSVQIRARDIRDIEDIFDEIAMRAGDSSGMVYVEREDSGRDDGNNFFWQTFSASIPAGDDDEPLYKERVLHDTNMVWGRGRNMRLGAGANWLW